MADTAVSAFAALTGATLAAGDKHPVIDVSASGAAKNKTLTTTELVVGLAASGLSAALIDTSVAHIDANGNDSTGDGTPAKPFRHIQAAITAGFKSFRLGRGSFNGGTITTAGDYSFIGVGHLLSLVTTALVINDDIVVTLSSNRSVKINTITAGSNGTVTLHNMIVGTMTHTGANGASEGVAGENVACYAYNSDFITSLQVIGGDGAHSGVPGGDGAAGGTVTVEFDRCLFATLTVQGGLGGNGSNGADQDPDGNPGGDGANGGAVQMIMRKCSCLATTTLSTSGASTGGNGGVGSNSSGANGANGLVGVMTLELRECYYDTFDINTGDGTATLRFVTMETKNNTGSALTTDPHAVSINGAFYADSVSL